MSAKGGRGVKKKPKQKKHKSNRRKVRKKVRRKQRTPRSKDNAKKKAKHKRKQPKHTAVKRRHKPVKKRKKPGHREKTPSWALKYRRKKRRKHTKPILLPKRYGRRYVSSKDLQGYLDGKRVFSGTRVIRKGDAPDPKGGTARHVVYEVAHFSDKLLPQSAVEAYCKKWLDKNYDKIFLFFKKTAPNVVIFCRFGSWLRNPESGETRKPFETNDMQFEDLTPRDFGDIVPDHYYDEGYMWLGLSLVAFTYG